MVFTQRVGGKINRAINSTTNKNTASKMNRAIGFSASSARRASLSASPGYHVLMMTRRAVLRLVAGMPFAGAKLAASKEFWEAEDPEQWSKDEVGHLLNQSPWAKPAAISFRNSGGVLNLPGFGRVSPGQPYPGAIPPGDKGRNASNPLAFQAVIRWESARPIRLAERNHAFDNSQFYVLAAIGDFPSAGEANEDLDAREQRREMFQEFTRLERKGDAPLYLDRIEPVATGIRFYFSRLDPIKESNKEITFTTKVGPLEFKARFALKDMFYRGKLEL